MSDSSPAVVLQQCPDYDSGRLGICVEQAMSCLGLSGRLSGQVVLLKPNLISHHGPDHSCTHPLFIKALACWLIDQGARVKVGDSPAFGSCMGVCIHRGIRDALAGTGAEIIEFATPVQKRLASGLAVTVAAEALECDLFIGLPKIKAHQQLFVTMAVKNIFGIVKGTRKAWLHMTQGNSHRRFAEMILDLQQLLPSQLHLGDAIEVMHVTGPLHGDRLTFSCIGGSRHGLALDTALLAALQLDHRQAPLWQAAATREMVGFRPEGLDYPLLRPEAFHGVRFEAPSQLNPIRFRPARFFSGMARRLRLACGQ